MARGKLRAADHSQPCGSVEGRTLKARLARGLRFPACDIPDSEAVPRLRSLSYRHQELAFSLIENPLHAKDVAQVGMIALVERPRQTNPRLNRCDSPRPGHPPKGNHSRSLACTGTDLGGITASSSAARRLGQRATHSRAFRRARLRRLSARQPGQLQRVVRLPRNPLARHSFRRGRMKASISAIAAPSFWEYSLGLSEPEVSYMISSIALEASSDWLCGGLSKFLR